MMTCLCCKGKIKQTELNNVFIFLVMPDLGSNPTLSPNIKPFCYLEGYNLEVPYGPFHPALMS